MSGHWSKCPSKTNNSVFSSSRAPGPEDAVANNRGLPVPAQHFQSFELK